MAAFKPRPAKAIVRSTVVIRGLRTISYALNCLALRLGCILLQNMEYDCNRLHQSGTSGNDEMSCHLAEISIRTEGGNARNCVLIRLVGKQSNRDASLRALSS